MDSIDSLPVRLRQLAAGLGAEARHVDASALYAAQPAAAAAPLQQRVAAAAFELRQRGQPAQGARLESLVAELGRRGAGDGGRGGADAAVSCLLHLARAAAAARGGALSVVGGGGGGDEPLAYATFADDVFTGDPAPLAPPGAPPKAYGGVQARLFEGEPLFVGRAPPGAARPGAVPSAERPRLPVLGSLVNVAVPSTRAPAMPQPPGGADREQLGSESEEEPAEPAEHAEPAERATPTAAWLAAGQQPAYAPRGWSWEEAALDGGTRLAVLADQRSGGCAGPPMVPLYFSAAGRQAFDAWSADAESRTPRPVDRHAAEAVVDEHAMVRTVCRTLCGLLCDGFRYREDSRRLEWVGPARTRMAGVRAVSTLMSGVAKAGTHALRLEETIRSLSDTSRAGLVSHAFAGSLKRRLQEILGQVMAESKTESFAQVHVTTRSLQATLAQLARLCCCEDESDLGGSETRLPRGTRLLDYLWHKRTVTCEVPDAASIVWSGVLRALFVETMAPWLRFADDWMFHGHLVDPFAEFAPEDLCDEESPARTQAPAFLTQSTWDRLLCCGWLLRLLRRHNSSHFMLTAAESGAPPLDINCALFGGSSGQDWQMLEDYVQAQQRWSDLIAAHADRERLHADSLLIVDRPEQSAKALAYRAANEAAQQKQTEAAAQKQALKLEYGQELKEQMQDNQRRSLATAANAASEQEAEEDATRESSNAVNTVRRQLEAEYSQRMAEAESRIMRAQWRQRRFRLYDQRVAHLASVEREQLSDAETLRGQVSPARRFEAAAVESSADAARDMASSQFRGILQEIAADSAVGATGGATKPVASGLAHPPLVAALDEDTTPIGSDIKTSPKQTLPPAGLEHAENRPQEPVLPTTATALDEGLPVPHAHSESQAVEAVADGIPAISGALLTDSTVVGAHEGALIARSSELQGATLPPEGSHWLTSPAFEHVGRLQHLLGEALSTTAPQTVHKGVSDSDVPARLLVKVCVEDVVAQQEHAVQMAMLHTFLHPVHFNLRHHLLQLRQYALLGAGVYADSMARAAFDGMTHSGRWWVTQAHCDAAMRTALALDGGSGGSGGSGSGGDFECKVSRPTAAEEALAADRPDSLLGALERISVNYRPTAVYPLNMVVLPQAAEGYSRLWCWLTKIRMVVHASGVMWRILQQVKPSSRAEASRLMVVNLVRHEVQQFGTVLYDYFMSQMQASWTALVEALETAHELKQLEQAHRDYVEQLLAGCLLAAASEPIVQLLEGMMAQALGLHSKLAKFAEAAALGDGDVAELECDDVRKLGMLFRRHLLFLQRLLAKAGDRGEGLALRLDFSGFLAKSA